MTTNFILIKSDMSIKAAMKSMIEQAAENDNVSTIYVEDANGAYCGAIYLRDLIVARNNIALDDIIMTSYPSVYATENIEECIDRLKDYQEDSIPRFNSRSRRKKRGVGRYYFHRPYRSGRRSVGRRLCKARGFNFGRRYKRTHSPIARKAHTVAFGTVLSRLGRFRRCGRV